MRLSRSIRCRAVVVATLAILSLGACGGGDSDAKGGADRAAGSADPATSSGEVALSGAAAAETAVAELAPLLARAGEVGTLSEAERRALEEAMRGVLLRAADRCEGCVTTVSYVDESAGGDHFRCEVRGPTGDAWAELQVFHRAGLSIEEAASWGRTTVAGQAASGLTGEHLFVWPGRFEIRAFARADSLRAGGELEALLERLPLRALAGL